MDQASMAAMTPVASDTPGWKPAQKILFRFVFSYLFLYNFPFPLGVFPIPYLDLVTGPFGEGWSNFVIWVGKHVFHVTATVHRTGSGDTMLAYLEVFTILVLSVIATLAWTLLDRKRSDYARLHEWLRVYVRFALAAAMLLYGGSKVIKSQFALPDPDRLVETFGESSPMGLLWTFMGSSTPYTVFSGLAEMLGGLLLLTRRTTLFGALVCIGVMSQVVMLNFCYDVPVKLYSAHLLAMAVFLAAPDLKQLANVLVLNRPAPAVEIRPLFQKRWQHRGALVLRTVFLLGVAAFWLKTSYDGSKQYGDLSRRPPFYGIWNVEEFVLDGQTRPPLLTDPLRWRRVTFSFPGYVNVQLMSDQSQFYQLIGSKAMKRWVLTKFNDRTWRSEMAYERPEPGLLVLDGTLDGKPVRIRMRRVAMSKFPLVSRGFHWISEYPFNR
jgi:uncharacterized membrane protein YphA (DoxX/SURF4 family)